MLTLYKSTVLSAAFLSGVAIAACRPPGPQIAVLPPAGAAPANVAPATSAITLQRPRWVLHCTSRRSAATGLTRVR
jgi:hypothetical protein